MQQYIVAGKIKLDFSCLKIDLDNLRNLLCLKLGLGPKISQAKISVPFQFKSG